MSRQNVFHGWNGRTCSYRPQRFPRRSFYLQWNCFLIDGNALEHMERKRGQPTPSSGEKRGKTPIATVLKAALKKFSMQRAKEDDLFQFLLERLEDID